MLAGMTTMNDEIKEVAQKIKDGRWTDRDRFRPVYDSFPGGIVQAGNKVKCGACGFVWAESLLRLNGKVIKILRGFCIECWKDIG